MIRLLDAIALPSPDPVKLSLARNGFGAGLARAHAAISLTFERSLALEHSDLCHCQTR